MPIWKKGVYITPSSEDVFPRNWLNCAAPVFFDFENAPCLTEATMRVAGPLWCLLPGRVHECAVVLRFSRDEFIRVAHERMQLFSTQIILERVEEVLLKAARAREAEVVRLHRFGMMMRRSSGWRTQGVRRGFRRF